MGSIPMADSATLRAERAAIGLISRLREAGLITRRPSLVEIGIVHDTIERAIRLDRAAEIAGR